MFDRTYTTIVFDLGNVLIPFDHNIWINRFNSVESGLGDLYYQKYMENYSVHREYESGNLSDNEFIKINLEWLSFKVNEEQFLDIFSNIFTFNSNVIKLLPALRKNYKVVLLSNTSHIHRLHGWGNYSFLSYFDKLILSYEVQAVKPEIEIYKAVEEYTKQKPESHIFIDDVPEYVEAAKSLGWDGIPFVGYDNLVEEFKSKRIL